MFRNTILLGLLATGVARAGIEILVGMPPIGKRTCPHYFLMFAGPRPHEIDTISRRNHVRTWRATIKQVIRTYRELGTAPEEYLQKIEKADDNYPAGSVIYIRSVNDVTGKVEGILRLVSGEPFSQVYFNLEEAKRREGDQPQVPMRLYYGDPAFQRFMQESYPNAVEGGRLVFAKGVKRSRVLVDLFSAAAEMTRQKEGKDRPERHLVVEVVEDAVPLVEAFPFKKVPIPIQFDNGRIFMVAKLTDFHDRLIVNPLKLKDEELDKVFEIFSDSPRLQSVFLHAFEQRAYESFAKGDFKRMWDDVQELIKHAPDNRQYRWLELWAETGRRYDWFTGKGKLQDAIDFLDSPKTQKRFRNETLPRESFPYSLILLKGMLYLKTGQLDQARGQRLAMRQLLNGIFVSSGHKSFIAPPKAYAHSKLMTWRQEIFDPTRAWGDPGKALREIEEHLEDLILVLEPEIYAYKAEALRALGRDKEAVEAQKIADALTIPQ